MSWQATYDHLVEDHKINYAWQFKLNMGWSNVDALHRREHLEGTEHLEDNS